MIAKRRKTRDNLPQNFEPLASKIGLLDRQASDVAARSRETCDEAGTNRVPRQREHDRNDRCHLLCCGDCGCRRDDDIDFQLDELGRDLGVALTASLRPAILDRDSATLDPSEFVQPLHESGSPWAPGRNRGRAQKPDGRQLTRLLRARSERPRRRAAEQRDELAPRHHSITSSARASRVAGISSLIAFAVLRLTMSLNFVGI